MADLRSVLRRDLFVFISISVLIFASSLSYVVAREDRSDAFSRFDTTMVPTTVENAVPSVYVPAPFIDPSLLLRDGPVDIPLRLQIPAIGLDAAMQGVGITEKKRMDAPMGGADSPNWQQAFWYRGSAIPGESSTSLLAGHADDPLGRPGVFAHLDSVIIGDVIVIHDNRTGLDVTFGVTEVRTYTLEETNDAVILSQIYGSGPVSGQVAQPSDDGLAHLTLITCSGIFSRKLGTHDLRLVIYATRI